MTQRRSTMSQMQILDLKEAFASLDNDGDGVINTEDLESVIRSLGLKPSKRELEQMIKEIDEDGNGEIDFEEFLQMMAKNSKSSQSQEEQLKDTFRMLDVHNTGEIPVDQLHSVIAKMDNTLSPEDIQEMINEVDADGSGTIDFNEFYKMLMPHAS